MNWENIDDQSMTKKILMIEDESGLIQVISAYLQQEGFTFYSSESGDKGLELFYQVNPDLIILDLMLPGKSGEQIAKEIRTRKDTPILMLTAKGTEEDKLTGLGIGADDYVVKPTSPREIVARVKTILRRLDKQEGRSQEDIIESGPLKINTLSREVYMNEEKISLTNTEYEILSMLALYPKKVFSRENLADVIFGYFWEGDPRTVDTHIKNLRKKIEPEPKNPSYIKTVRGAGYQFNTNK